jgi:hypothetical protein
MEEELFLSEIEMEQKIKVDFMEETEESICEMDEMFEPSQYSDPNKNYERVMDTLSQMQSTKDFEQKFFDTHIVHIHAYKITFPSMKDIHTEIDATHFRAKLDECDKIIDVLIDMYDCNRWFPVEQYYRLNELFIEILNYVKELEELEDMMSSMCTS